MKLVLISHSSTKGLYIIHILHNSFVTLLAIAKVSKPQAHS